MVAAAATCCSRSQSVAAGSVMSPWTYSSSATGSSAWMVSALAIGSRPGRRSCSGRRLCRWQSASLLCGTPPCYLVGAARLGVGRMRGGSTVGSASWSASVRLT